MGSAASAQRNALPTPVTRVPQEEQSFDSDHSDPLYWSSGRVRAYDAEEWEAHFGQICKEFESEAVRKPPKKVETVASSTSSNGSRFAVADHLTHPRRDFN